MRAFILAVALCVGVIGTGAASASPSGWWVTPTHNGLECTHHQYEGSIVGPFSSKAACEALLTPASGQVCEDGETLTVEYPNLYVEQHEGVTVGACAAVVPLGAAVEPPHDSGSFLCYSIGGTPKVAPDAATALLWEAAGYWLPSAVAGNTSGENVGAYHLVCNAPGVLGVDGNAPAATLYVDNNGGALGFIDAQDTGWVGVYPVTAS